MKGLFRNLPPLLLSRIGGIERMRLINIFSGENSWRR